MRLYEAKIYEGDEEIRKYIPARNRSDNTLGLYETHLGKFYAKKGVGDFISGNSFTGERVSFYEGGTCSTNEIIEI
jgi:hypothetical protein